MPDPLAAQLRAACPLPLAVVGVGNPMRGDDGFGPAVLAALPAAGTASGCREPASGPAVGLALFDAGMAPENWLGPIARANPRAILVLDAADLGEPPGTLRLLPPAALESVGACTHGLPLGFFLNLVQDRCGAPAFLLAAQPERTGLGDEMTEPVRAAVLRAAAAVAALTGS